MKYLISLVCFMVLASVALAQDLSAPSLQLTGSKVAIESDAKRIAFEHYVKKMKAEVSSYEGISSLSVFKIGYDIPEFATAGDIIWQANIKTLAVGLESKLRGIIWVHSRTGKVHFVTGAWDHRE